MRWLDRLERKYGRFAIRGLMTFIVAMNGAVFLLSFLDVTGTLTYKLMLIPSLVLKGEVWRIVSYIFIPPDSSPLFIIFVLYFYYMIGSSLEHEWGSFRFNVYYLIGMLGTTAAAFITGGGTNAIYLNLSLFLAFAAIYPNYEILIFFMLPVKVKYLAWVDWAFIAFTVVFSPLPLKAAAVVSVLNYFIFFGGDIIKGFKLRRSVHYNRRRFFNEIRDAERERNKYK